MDRYIYIFEDGTIRKSYAMVDQDWESVEAGILDVIKVYPDNSDPEIAMGDGSKEFGELPTLH